MILSKVRCVALLITGISMFFFEYIGLLHGWRSFFILNTIYCCIVSGFASKLLFSLENRVDLNALSASRFLKNLSMIFSSGTYDTCAMAYFLVSLVLQTLLFYLRHLLVDYFGLAMFWVTYEQAFIFSIVGSIAMAVNAYWVSKSRMVDILRVSSTTIFLSAILMQSSFFLMESNPWQLQVFFDNSLCPCCQRNYFWLQFVFNGDTKLTW